MSTDKAMREAFEAWAVEEGFAWIEDACEILNEPAKFRWNPYNDCGKAGAWLAWQAALASSAAAPEQADRAQRMRDAGYTRRPTLREMAEPDHDTDYEQRWPNSVTPAPAAEATMSDAIAAGDGTLHGAIDYWQARALAAEAKVPSEAEQDAHATNQVLANNYLHMTCAPPAAPLSEPTAEGVTEDEWLALAERHAIGDWNSRKPDGYLNAVKALCTDFAALSSPAAEGNGE